MENLEKLEKRWLELVGKPKSKVEVEETLLLAKQLSMAWAKEYQGMIDELSAIGIIINSIWDLVNTKTKYPLAIPILLKYLTIVKQEKNKEGIIRALTVPEAKGYIVQILINEYNNTPKDRENLRWVIGNAVNATLTKNEVEQIFPIVLNQENGTSRQMFVAALGKVKSQKAEDVLINLLDDLEVAPNALEALGRMKSTKARDKILMLTHHSNALIRKEAQKALKKTG